MKEEASKIVAIRSSIMVYGCRMDIEEKVKGKDKCKFDLTTSLVHCIY